MELINRIRKNKKGFTLVEIIVVLVILAILAAFTIPTMLGFVNDAKGKALITEARQVYIAAQATATECAATAVAYSGTMDSADCYATVAPTDGPSKKMLDYLDDDIEGIIGANTAATTTKAVWTVTTDANAKVTMVEYWKGNYKVTIDKTAGSTSTGAVVTKFR